MCIACWFAAMLVLAASGVARGDEVTDQLDLAKLYYDEGDYGGAITELEFTLDSLRSRLSELLAATMPSAPDLWSAKEVEIEAGAAMFGGGTMITRDYIKRGGGLVEAQLIIDGPMVQALSAVLGNPAMLASQDGLERMRIGRDNALLSWNPAERSGDISLSLGNRMVAKIHGSDIEDKTVLVDLMKEWDLDALKSVAGF